MSLTDLIALEDNRQGLPSQHLLACAGDGYLLELCLLVMAGRCHSDHSHSDSYSTLDILQSE